MAPTQIIRYCYIDVGDKCRRQFLRITILRPFMISLRCWKRIFHMKSHQRIDLASLNCHQHNAVTSIGHTLLRLLLRNHSMLFFLIFNIESKFWRGSFMVPQSKTKYHRSRFSPRSILVTIMS